MRHADVLFSAGETTTLPLMTGHAQVQGESHCQQRARKGRIGRIGRKLWEGLLSGGIFLVCPIVITFLVVTLGQPKMQRHKREMVSKLPGKLYCVCEAVDRCVNSRIDAGVIFHFVGRLTLTLALCFPFVLTPFHMLQIGASSQKILAVESLAYAPVVVRKLQQVENNLFDLLGL